MQDGQDGPRVASRYACKVDFRVKRASPQATLELQDTLVTSLSAETGIDDNAMPRGNARCVKTEPATYTLYYVYMILKQFLRLIVKKRGYLYLLGLFLVNGARMRLPKKGEYDAVLATTPRRTFSFLLLLLKVACVRA